MYRFGEIGLTLALILSIASGCSGIGPDEIGNDPSGLRGCPKSPNCVSSEAKDEQHAIGPFHLKGDPKVSWPIILDEIASMPKWRIVKATDNYLHVECKSRIFRFIDDLELSFNSFDLLDFLDLLDRLMIVRVEHPERSNRRRR